MDIAHLGERTAAELLERELIADPADMFFLTSEQVATSCPTSRTSRSPTCSAAIAAAKDRPIDRLLYGFGIRHVGATAARRSPTRSRSMDKIAARARRGACRGRRRGRGDRGRRARVLRSSEDGRASRKAAAGRRAHERGAEAESGRAAHRQDLRHHRHARDDVARRGEGSASRRWAAR